MTPGEIYCKYIGMKKILFVNPTGARGGGVSVAMGLGLALRNRYDVSMFFPESSALVQPLEKQGISLFFADKRNGLSAIFALRNLLKKEHFDVVHAHGTRAAVWVKLAFILGAPRRPFVYTLHGVHFLRKNFIYRSLFLIFERMTNGMVSALVTVSNEDYVMVTRAHIIGGESLFLIENGIAIGEFLKRAQNDRLREILGIKAEIFVVVTVCRLAFPKDVATIVRAVHIPSPRPIKLVVAGDGPDRAVLEALDAKLGGGAVFLGDRGDISDILAMADIFVLSSHWEGMPITILEAMAMGRPVIGSDTFGIRDLVQEGETGLLFPLGDAEALKKKIELLMKNKDLQKKLTIGGKKMVENNFTEEKMVARYENIYKKCGFFR